MIVVIVVMLIAALLGFLLYMDVLSLRKATIIKIPGFVYVYKEFKGGFADFGTFWFATHQDLSHHNVRLDLYPFCSIFFDDPSTVEDKEAIRFSYGIKISEINSESVVSKLTALGYKSIVLPSIEAAHYSYKYRSRMSFMLSFVFWGKIRKLVEGMKLEKFVSAGIEVYDFEKAKVVELYLPIGPDAARYNFTSLPK